MTWLVLGVLGLATFRLARFVSTDEITEPLRCAVARRYPPAIVAPLRPQTGQPVPDAAALRAHWTVRFLACEWCTGFWIAGASVLAAHYGNLVHGWCLTGLAWPAVAGAAGLASRWSS